MVQRWAFVAEWLDPRSGVLWRYQLFWYPASGEIELFDSKRKLFLRKTKVEGITSDAQLYVGASLTVFARLMRLIEYGDEATRAAVEARAERTLALIKPDAVQHAGKILNAITTAGFAVNNLRMCQLSKAQAAQFYAEHQGKPFFERLTAFMSSGPLVALELMAASGVRKWRDLLGPTDSNIAREEAPNSIRALFGSDGTANAAHGSASRAEAAAELAFFFGGSSSCSSRIAAGSAAASSSTAAAGGRGGASGVQPCARCQGTTLGLIKPHAVKDGLAGIILDCVQEVFQVTGLRQCKLDKAAAAEFLEVYRGVLPPGEFSSMVDEVVSGPCIAVEVADRDGGDPVEPFRQLCGPADPELGRVLRPASLRARFGVSRVRNALHCTDLAEDARLETSYLFSLLPQA